MFEQLRLAVALLMGNLKENIITGVIMVSAIIVFIGLLKPLLFDRIKCKPLRKAAIAFSDIVVCLAATAVAFWVNGLSFGYYLYAAIVVFLATIVVYWFYENTCLRNLIQKIGSIMLTKAAQIATGFLTDKEKKDLKTELNSAKQEIKKTLKNELHSASPKKKSDKELSNL